ncbi:hypothetical protein BDW66DRAFT_103219 [Aspergillus desertorum]
MRAEVSPRPSAVFLFFGFYFSIPLQLLSLPSLLSPSCPLSGVSSFVCVLVFLKLLTSQYFSDSSVFSSQSLALNQAEYKARQRSHETAPVGS